MTFVPLTPVRHGFFLLIVLACLVVIMPGHAPGQGGGASQACRRWPQDRLIVAHDLQSRHFLLEAKGQVRLVTGLASAEQRGVYHRTFSLSLDTTELASLFYGNAAGTCWIGKDQDRTQSLRIPVFFVGRIGESAEDLKENAESVAFAPSESLDKGKNFPDIQFRLRRGGSRFSDIRPFFRCGLPGLMLCEDTCPDDSAGLAASLVNTVVNAQNVPVAPPPGPARPANPRASPQRDSPQTAQTPSAPAPSIPPAAGDAPAPPPSQQVPPRKAPEPGVSPQPAQPTPPPAELRRFVLSFELKPGEPLEPGDVLEAEGSLSIEGTQLFVTAGGLAADLTEQAFQKAASPAYLKTLFRRHAVTAVKINEAHVVLTVEQLYARMSSLAVKIQDPAGEPVRTCDIALHVDANRRLGAGWAKAAAGERGRGLPFYETGDVYRLRLPADVEPNQLLISTSEPGKAAKLSSAGGGCELETRLDVPVEEIRSGTISRSLQETGPVLVSLLSTDSDFAGSLGPAAVDGFWAAALSLVREVSKKPWERNILARAQAPGPHQDTAILQDMRDGGLPAGEGQPSPIVNRMIEGSRPRPEPLPIIKLKPVERYQLDLALKIIRQDADISTRQSVGQESLLLISGSLRGAGSYFCQHPMPGADTAPWARPQWVTQARRIFVLEVWSIARAIALQRYSRAMPAPGAPEGVFLCNIPGADGDKIALYGILPGVLSSGGERAAAFDYLKAQATGHLKPSTMVAAVPQ